MKLLLLLMVVATVALADVNGCTETASVIPPEVTDGADITLSVVNDWSLADKALGLDVFISGATVYILGANNELDIIQAYDMTGTPQGTMALSGANGSCFGLSWNNDSVDDAYYTDDWISSNLFYTDDFGSTWTTTPNPAGTNGRGMDFDDTDYWCTNGDGGGLWRFQPGTGQENISIPEVPSQPSGLAVFPYEGELGIVVTTYNTHNFYFYQWDGADITYIGSAACPVAGIAGSYGLTYNLINDTLYWSFKLGSVYHLAEVSFDISQALESSSWGSIKASF